MQNLQCVIALLLGSTTTVFCVVLPDKTTQNRDPWTWSAILPQAPLHSIVCPGGTSCPDFATCCKMGSGDYGCCPFPEAICCDDGIHCCPKSTHCDLAQGRCTSNTLGVSLPMAEKFVWKQNQELDRSVKSITCPDRQSECPDSTTCCLMASGDWGCCPFASAVCCEDKQHCCPKDCTCNLKEQRCQQPAQEAVMGTVALGLVKHKGKKLGHGGDYYHNDSRLSDHPCADPAQKCADDATCCKMKTGTYGCCPFPNADCCMDGLHCCPEGSKCDVKGQKCGKVNHDLFRSHQRTGF